jgi:hypothetical protein
MIFEELGEFSNVVQFPVRFSGEDDKLGLLGIHFF